MVYFALSQPVSAQFSDDFSDADFSANPAWTGNGTKFVIDNFELRLQAPPVAGIAYLSTPSLSINGAVWEFNVRMDFPTSGNNFTRVYLTANQEDLSGALNGYFVLIGDTPDEVSLYRQSGSTRTKIIDGLDGSVNQPVVNVAVKVTRDSSGNWELFRDVGIGGTLIAEGGTQDSTFPTSAYFGVYCEYTATRSDKFFFDDFVVSGDPFVDSEGPQLQSVQVPSAAELVVVFNELLDPVSANATTNYTVGGGIGSPALAEMQPGQVSVRLTFSTNFPNGKTQLLTVNGVKDVQGNTMAPSAIAFLYFQPVLASKKDIIITEIFADPSPQVGLPDAEYIELHNRSAHPFDLNGWKLSDGSSTATLPTHILLPGEYRIVTASSNAAKFGATAPITGASNFPTLNNDGDALTLKSSEGLLIDSVNYALSWYRDIDKQEGGWSLELIDLENECGEEDNWTSSENENGGTPGFTNSAQANKPDLTGPKLLSVTAVSASTLLLSFDEKLENPIAASASFVLSPVIAIDHAAFESTSLRSILLTLQEGLEPKVLYTITLENLFDCSGNPIDESFNALQFALPEKAAPGDILLNEILFNPRPNGVDFVELFNNSEKFIDLKNWNIANLEEALIENPEIISSEGLILAPQQYLVLTTDPVILKANYPQGVEKKFRKISLPSFADDAGSVALTDEAGQLMDYFLYEENLHSAFIKDEEGVSLERISFFEATQSKENWTSASSVSGFATPGFLNSNFRPENKLTQGEVVVKPEVFAPASGADGFAQINFQFDQPGFVANVKIYDQQGRLVRTLANNETLGFEGFFRWDGDQDDGGKARIGYYFVWFEVFNAVGTMKTFRKRVVIAAR